jgi:hypothetical protein
MSSYLEGQVHQLMESLEKSGFTAGDITNLGQFKGLAKVRDVVRGISEIVTKPLDPNQQVLTRQNVPLYESLDLSWSISEQLGQRSGHTLDTTSIRNMTYLEDGESAMIGELLLKRIKTVPNVIQLDVEDFNALWYEKGHKALEWLFKTRNITHLSFWGTILRDSRYGDRGVIHVWRTKASGWLCEVKRLDSSWDRNQLCSIIAS